MRSKSTCPFERSLRVRRSLNWLRSWIKPKPAGRKSVNPLWCGSRANNIAVRAQAEACKRGRPEVLGINKESFRRKGKPCESLDVLAPEREGPSAPSLESPARSDPEARVPG